MSLYANESISALYLGSREGDPEGFIENVSTIHGDYSEYAIDLAIPGPDPLILSRYYSSREGSSLTSLGGWHFYSHCYLTLQNDPKGKFYTTSEGRFDKVHVYVGTSEGSILTYKGWQNSSNPVAKSLFHIDMGKKALGITNTARGSITAWTNLKNHQLYFENNRFEFFLNNGGKRSYIKQASLPLYLLEQEILPSGNKICYEYDTHFRPLLIKMVNHSEKKVLSWIKIEYGDTIHIVSSDGQTVDYQLEQNCLVKAVRSHQPSVHYSYNSFNGKSLLTRKDLPEGRFTAIDYYKGTHQVKSVTTPAGISDTASTLFTYKKESTEIHGPLGQKTVHRFNKNFQLTSIEHYLGEALYRVQKKTWGLKKEATYLIKTALEDANGDAYYIKTLSYDESGNVIQEREYGNLTGANPYPIPVDEEGNPIDSQESHIKTYSYSTTEQEDLVTQTDAKGSGIQYVYKKGTWLLLKKFILQRAVILKRWFYDYNEDGVLIKITVDDGDETEREFTDYISETKIIYITPKQDLPHLGAPKMIEEKYVNSQGRELLLKKRVNHFDAEGNLSLQDIYDANGEHRYTLRKSYEKGLLTMESDPMGNETLYSYDKNHNLISLAHSNKKASFEYRYDLKNRCIYTAEKDNQGNAFETHVSYNALGHKLSETDRFGQQTLYYPDVLGRIQSISYPNSRPYIYQYNLFDHLTSITDPKGSTTTSSYTARGQLTAIKYRDGMEERFKYDAEGSLHRHLSKDGTVKVFEYDHLGRVEHIEHYARSHKESGDWISSIRYSYNTLHKTSEEDEKGYATTYIYDKAGRIVSLFKDSKKTEFFYDALGRTSIVKKWKTDNTFTLERKEYDLLDNIIEEHVEDHKGNLLLKYKYIYNESALLQTVVGYPQNRESPLKSYEYDSFGRVIAVRDAFNQTRQIIYDDQYVNELGQKVVKQIEIDPSGNQREEIFNPTGHLAKVIQKNQQGQILSESECIYDDLGNRLLEKNAVIFSGELLRSDSAAYTYGSNNRMATITHAPTSSDTRTSSFTYNAYGDLVTKLGPEGKSPVTYQYNQAGKLASLSCPEKNKEINHKFSYDNKGNLKKIQLGSTHTILHEFDPNNQLISETIQDQLGSYQISYQLDGEGLIESIQLPDGSSIKYDYMGPFVTNVYRLSKDKKELYKHQILSRHLMGNILKEILISHAGERTQTWDALGRRTEIITDFFQDKIPEGGYGPLQNIKKRETLLDDESYTLEYQYDDLFHLISEKGDIERNYTFDSLQNRLTKENVTYQINELNQLLATDEVVYTFDLNGNLYSKTIDGKTWIFQYNALNQLLSIQDPNQTTFTFTYDLSGRRLCKKIESKGKKPKVFRYFYVGQTEIGALDEKGVIVELRIPSHPNHPEKAPFIAFELKKEIYLPLYDLQRNVVCLVDPTDREVVESYRYSAFGESSSDSDRENPWRYLGKRMDSEVGLIYFGYRYYDPEIGRWISPDPAGNIDGPNPYAFCLNNPLTYTDYFGLASESTHASIDETYFYGEYEPHCFCETHRDCKRGGDIGHSSSNFPTISYSDYFETYYADAHHPDGLIKNCYDPSCYYDLSDHGLPNLPNDLRIGFINGILNNFIGSQASAQYLSRLSGGYNIDVVYNATHGPNADILECALGLNYLATEPVRQLHKMWNSFFDNSSSNSKYLMICHSQGAIHVRNALLGYPPELRNRILVVAIAPGGYIYQESCLDVFHYRAKSSRDLVPRLDLAGSQRERDSTVTLHSHPNAIVWDHEFMSPTYEKRLRRHIINYISSQGERF